MTYFTVKRDKSNIKKTNLEVPQTLLDNLQLCQCILSLSYIDKKQLVATNKKVFHKIFELEFTLITPIITFKEFSSKF